MLFIYYPKCSTCQKAKKWLDGRNISYTGRCIHEEKPSYGELKQWHQDSGLPLKRFFNTSGLLYKSMDLKNKLPQLTEEEQLQLLASDGMLVKRPLLIWEEGSGDSKRRCVLVGFREAEWEDALAVKK